MNPAPGSEETLFAGALKLPPGRRPEYLRQACGGDLARLQKIEALLRAHEEAGNFLDGPTPGGEGAVGVSVPSLVEEVPGSRIGRYKVLQQIGEGGCGVVFMAEQDEPVRRRVALKVIKLGMDTKAVIARFEAERQALAMMDHPNIARVLDAGATERGRPYFVMELVRGIPVTKYCDDHNLDTQERLELFILICQAIQHAHQKGVIHRDIKPTNILVTLHDGLAVPKIIDFGIAKATHGRLTEQTLFTAFEQFIGTPAYVSPEQAEMSGLDIDTRTDIYSLGVLLYELLSSRTPFDTKVLQEGGLDEMRRRIREQEPLKPSARLSTLDEQDRDTVARRRDTEPGKLCLLLRGDLDWIVMRCLEKNRARRYETANGLAVDIQRYLRNEPVVARPPSTAYLLQKLFHRHRLVFALVAAVAASLVLGLTVSLKALVRARVAEEEQIRLREQAEAARRNEVQLRRQAESGEQLARTAADRREQVAAFMKEIFKDIGLFAAVAGDTQLLSRILDQAAGRLEKELTDQAEVKADLLETLGGISFNIGELPRAESMFTKALALRRQSQGAEHPDVARSLNYLGLVLSAQGKLIDAEKNLRSAIELQKKVSGGAYAEIARSSSNLGWVLAQQGRLDEGGNLITEALEQQRKLLGHDHPDVAQSLKRFGSVLVQEGRLAEAEKNLQEALEINIRAFGHDHLEVASSLNFLAVTLAIQDQDSGKILHAIRLYREALGIREKLRTLGGIQSPDALTTVLTQQGTLAEVEVALREARRYAHNLYPDDRWKDAHYRALSTFVLLEEQKFSEAEEEARQCYDLRKELRPDDWSTFHAYSMMGDGLAGQGRVAEALPFLLDGYEGMKQREPAIPEGHKIWLGEALSHLVKVFTVLHQPAEAGKWQLELMAWAKAHPDMVSIAQSR